MATRYLVSGGTGDYNSTTNWSATSGGASGASFPLTGDDIVIDSNSANAPLIINVVSSCRSFVCSNYTGTVSINNTFNVTGSAATGNITLSSGMTITGLANFTKVQPSGAASTITSNGVVFDCPFSYQTVSGAIITITGTMQVKELIVPTDTTFSCTINGSIIRVLANVTHNCPVVGTATLELIGSTPATINQIATRYLTTNLVINKGVGTFNQVDLYWGASSRTLTYTSGIVNHTGILAVGNSATLNTNGMIWNIIRPNNFINLTSVCFANKIEQITGVSVTFSGTFGFSINEFNMVGTNGGFITLTSNVTYIINNSIIVTSATTNLVTFRCASGANAIINLKQDAYMKLLRINFQRITASNKTLRGVSSTVDSFSRNVFKLTSNINPYIKTK